MKFCVHFSSSACMLRVPSISIPLMRAVLVHLSIGRLNFRLVQTFQQWDIFLLKLDNRPYGSLYLFVQVLSFDDIRATEQMRTTPADNCTARGCILAALNTSRSTYACNSLQPMNIGQAADARTRQTFHRCGDTIQLQHGSQSQLKSLVYNQSYNRSALPPFRIQCLIGKKGRIGPSLGYCSQMARPLACSEVIHRVGFEVLTAVSMKMAVFWVVAPCSLVEVYQRFRGPCCLHHQGDEYSSGYIPLALMDFRA
jgi:hypothetical protein